MVTIIVRILFDHLLICIIIWCPVYFYFVWTCTCSYQLFVWFLVRMSTTEILLLQNLKMQSWKRYVWYLYCTGKSYTLMSNQPKKLMVILFWDSIFFWIKPDDTFGPSFGFRGCFLVKRWQKENKNRYGAEIRKLRAKLICSKDKQVNAHKGNKNRHTGIKR